MTIALPDAFAPYLSEQPAFCFTTDIEWAPDWAIADLFALADSYEVLLTPFLTHRSDYLWQRLSGSPEAAGAGVHPNFLPGSTHGGTVTAVIDHVTTLWPAARSFRSHCFYDETRMNRQMADRGFRYDSNLCAFLQPGLVPLRTATPIIRFPVFWEDDLHSGSGLPWTIAAIEPALRSPGLKIFNVHPPRVALNVPDEAFHESRRALLDGPGDGQARAHQGPGTRTFLEALFSYARTNGNPMVGLADLYRQAVDRGVPLAVASSVSERTA
ncbi:MAG TPA: hypothetical protein VM070_01450 [Candidatus Saccharimonadales bacterium]|nr:hypothetical protein [Candidatus Saccharimonadales bacterium]